ncbi:MAG: selenide, water dikinase SelD [Treponemataceae bacterium]
MNTIQMTKLANCAGCGAKVGAGTLSKLLEGFQTHSDKNLLVGYDTSDDASVYKISDDLAIVQTVDFFPPIVDDPYIFGLIAATNAISDIYAMGGEPRLALNIMGISGKMDNQSVREVLRGGYEKAYEAGVIITGGHTIQDEEPKYGLAVTGFVHPKYFYKNCSAQIGDALILTKPLGIGIITTAAKAERINFSDTIYQNAIAQMCQLNDKACAIMKKYAVHSCTDITGFSLLGHALEMASGSNIALHFESNHIPVIEGVASLSKENFTPSGMQRNRSFAEHAVYAPNIEKHIQDIYFDPQTSGGLLIAVAQKDAFALQKELSQAIPCAKIIGYTQELTDKKIIITE